MATIFVNTNEYLLWLFIAGVVAELVMAIGYVVCQWVGWPPEEPPEQYRPGEFTILEGDDDATLQ